MIQLSLGLYWEILGFLPQPVSYEASLTVERRPARPAIIAIFGCNLTGAAAAAEKDRFRRFVSCGGGGGGRVPERARAGGKSLASCMRIIAYRQGERWGQKGAIFASLESFRFPKRK